MLAVGREPAGADEEVNVGVVQHRPRPSVEDRQDGGRRPQPAWIGGEFEYGLGGATKERSVHLHLMPEGERAQFGGQSEREQEVRQGKKERALTLQPGIGLLAVAFGTVPIPAGVIGVAQVPAVITLRDVAAKELGAAVLDVPESALLAGEQRVACPVSCAVLAEDVRHLDHAGSGFTDRASGH